MRNELVIDGVVVQVTAGRFTPAGLAATQMRLRHAPDGIAEAAFDIEVIAYGDLAADMQTAQPGDAVRIKGRLQPKHRRTSALAIHATQFKFASKG